MMETNEVKSRNIPLRALVSALCLAGIVVAELFYKQPLWDKSATVIPTIQGRAS